MLVLGSQTKTVFSMVIAPFDVSSSSEGILFLSPALPKSQPDMCDFEFLVSSISDSLNLIAPLDVRASIWTGLRSIKLTEIAPLLVSNLHFPSREQLVNCSAPLLVLA